MSQKSYDESPTLYLIPTPIGNMEDLTYRTVETLKLDIPAVQVEHPDFDLS